MATIALVDGHVDLAAYEVHRAHTVRLTKIEGSLLAYLVEHAGRTVGHDELLTEVWGYASGVRTRTVQVTVHRLRDKLEVDPKQPVHLLTTWGAGYRFVAATRTDGFFGRERAAAQVSAALDAGKQRVTLVGVGGIGKTRLATRLARGRDAVVVRLESAAEADDVVWMLAEALGVQRPAASRLDGVIEALLASSCPLLVLDNLEQVPDAGSVVDRLPCAVVATSRRPMGCADEDVFRLEGLSIDESVDLLLHRCGRSDPDPQQRQALEHLAARLDGIPLALELAAARLAIVSAADLSDRVEERLSLLGDRRRADRQAAMSSVIAVSWALLSVAQQQALVRLSPWVDGFDLAGVDAVLAELGEPADLVTDLLEASLITQVQGPWTPRFHMYGVIRTFALARADDPDALRARCASALVDRVDRALGGRLFEDAFAAEALAERNNLLAARAWVDGDLAGRLAGALWAVLRGRGAQGLLVDVLAEAADRVPPGSELDAVVHTHWGKHHAAALPRASKLATEHGRGDLLAKIALFEAGHERNRGGDPLPLVLRARQLADAAGDRTTAGRAAGFEGIVRFEAGDVDAGERLFREGLAASRVAGDEWGCQIRLSNLVVALSRRGEWAAAEQACLEAEEIAASFGHATSLLTGYRGTARLAVGDLDGARELLDIASTEMLKAAVRGQAGAFRMQRARAEWEAGEVALAAQTCAEALEILRVDPRSASDAQALAGWLALERGQDVEAADAFGQAEQVAERTGHPDALASALAGRAALAVLAGELVLAEGLRGRAIAIAADAGAVALHAELIGWAAGEAPGGALGRLLAGRARLDPSNR